MAEGQYSYNHQPNFGFSPSRDVGNWQSVDPLVSNDGHAIPPEVILGVGQATRETTFVRWRYSRVGVYPFPMSLEPYGSEYWIAKSDPSLAATAQDLVVRVNQQGAFSSVGATREG